MDVRQAAKIWAYQPYLSCDELLTLKAQAIRPQTSGTGIPFLEATLVFRKTNNDANKGDFSV